MTNVQSLSSSSCVRGSLNRVTDMVWLSGTGQDILPTRGFIMSGSHGKGALATRLDLLVQTIERFDGRLKLAITWLLTISCQIGFSKFFQLWSCILYTRPWITISEHRMRRHYMHMWVLQLINTCDDWFIKQKSVQNISCQQEKLGSFANTKI